MNGLRDIADDFVESVSVFAAEIAKHGNSDAIRAKDVQLHFEQNWGLPNPNKKAKTDVAATDEEKSVLPVSAGASALPLSAISNPDNASAARMSAHMQRLNVKARMMIGGGGANPAASANAAAAAAAASAAVGHANK